MLDTLIRSRGYSQVDIARATGLSEDKVNNLCRGKTRLKGTTLKLIAQQLRMTDEELRHYVFSGAPLTDAPRTNARFSAPPAAHFPQEPIAATVNVRGKLIVIPNGNRPVPIYGSVPAGTPGQSFSDAVDVEFMTDWSGPFNRWGCFVDGFSMSDEFLPGDAVIFDDRAANPNQAVYAIKDGDATFKVLREPRPGHLELHPLNYDVCEPISAEGWDIKGVLLRRVRNLPGGRVIREDFPPEYAFPKLRR